MMQQFLMTSHPRQLGLTRLRVWSLLDHPIAADHTFPGAPLSSRSPLRRDADNCHQLVREPWPNKETLSGNPSRVPAGRNVKMRPLGYPMADGHGVSHRLCIFPN